MPTVRAILTNGRYTGYEVWGTFAKAEQLIDSQDPTLGYRTRLIRSDQRPVRSREQSREAIVDVFTWTRANHLLNARAVAARANPGKHVRNRGASYPLKGLMTCTICGRRMQVQKSAKSWVRYRCRARDLTPGTLLDHPPSVSIGQTAVLQRINPWLAEMLRGPDLGATMDALVNVVEPPRPDCRVELLRRREGDAREKLRRLVDALALGAFPAESLAAPISAAQADADAARAELEALSSPAGVPAREQVKQALEVLGDRVEDVFSEDRSPALLHDFYSSIGLSLTWDHRNRRLTAELDLSPAVTDLMGQAHRLTNRGGKQCVRGGT